MKKPRSQHLAGILARIDERLAELGMTESAASKLAGKADAIRNIRRAVESGKDDAGVSTATLYALSPVLKCTPGWLADGTTTLRVNAGRSIPSDSVRVALELVLRKIAGMSDTGSQELAALILEELQVPEQLGLGSDVAALRGALDYIIRRSGPKSDA